MPPRTNPFQGGTGTGRAPLGGFGLGAVGGPGGVAAGTLRVLVEFLTQYDAGAVGQLENDIKKLEKSQNESDKRLVENQRLQAKIRADISDAGAARRLITDKEQRKNLALMLDLEAQARRLRQKDPAATKELNDQAKALGVSLLANNKISEADLNILRNAYKLTQQRRNLERGETTIRSNTAQRTAELKDYEAQLLKMQQIRAEVVPKLGALALGAVGNIFGGALIGVGFAAAQALLDSLSNTFQDIVDPARHAREAIKEVSKEIDSLASSEKITRLAAVKKYLEDLGPLAQGIDPTKLAQADIANQVTTLVEKRNKAADSAIHSAQLEKEAVDNLTKSLVEQDRISGKLAMTAYMKTNSVLSGQFQIPGPFDSSLDKSKLYQDEARAIYNVSAALANAQGAAAGLAAEAQRVRDAFEAAYSTVVSNSIASAFSQQTAIIQETAKIAVDSINRSAASQIAAAEAAGQRRMDSIQSSAEARINGLQKQMQALEVIPSARTKSLQSQLDNLSNAGPSAATQRLLDQIKAINEAEAKHNYLLQVRKANEDIFFIQLTRRLSLEKTEIDISKYSGQARLIAIDAEIARLNKQANAQQRMNQLLDLQYRMSQRINRNQGESIQDYLSRRAQEYRHQLEEQANFQRQDSIDRLSKERETAQYEIDLRKATEARKQLFHDHYIQHLLKNLDELVKKSELADRKDLDARRKILQEQLRLSQHADQKALESRRQALQDQIDAVRKSEQAQTKAVAEQTKLRTQHLRDQADAAIAATNTAATKQIEAVKQREIEMQKLAQAGAADQYKLMLQGAKSLAELQAVAGQAGGSELAYNELLTSIKGLGLPDAYTASLLATLGAERNAYQARLAALTPPVWTSHAQGGVFPLTNAMNFGNNMRVGEQGKEIGIVLSNKVTQALRESQGGSGIGTLNVYSYEDPKRSEYRIRKIMREEADRAYR